jgi:hypothetical protein
VPLQGHIFFKINIPHTCPIPPSQSYREKKRKRKEKRPSKRKMWYEFYKIITRNELWFYKTHITSCLRSKPKTKTRMRFCFWKKNPPTGIFLNQKKILRYKNKKSLAIFIFITQNIFFVTTGGCKNIFLLCFIDKKNIFDAWC